MASVVKEGGLGVTTGVNYKREFKVMLYRRFSS